MKQEAPEGEDDEEEEEEEEEEGEEDEEDDPCVEECEEEEEEEEEDAPFLPMRRRLLPSIRISSSSSINLSSGQGADGSLFAS